MNLKFYLFLLVLMSLISSAIHAQDLRNLRAKPDTAIRDDNTQALDGLKNIYVPIPKLDLEVNYWKHWSRFGVNANQASFSDNWSNGGVNSMALGFNTWHKSEYNKNKINFTSEIDLRYGKIKNKDQLAKKNNDRIFWDNKLSYKISKAWAVYASITFESQFDNGFSYARDADNNEFIKDTISSFMAPGYFTESVGLEYKPDNTFSVRLGTGTARQTLILDDRIAPPATATNPVFGVDPGKNFRNDLAFQITANLDRNLSKNLNLKGRYNLFADYTDITDPDHRLDLTLTAKVTRVINVTLTGIGLYDSEYIAAGDTKAKIQYSQALALGLTFNFPR
ncbi:DUF3078 domain-containing protein [Sphingobacterium hungaricum]